MKAILEFSLPEEQGEFDLACRAGDYLSALCEFRTWFRNERKYNNAPEYANKVWDEFHRILAEFNVADGV